MDKSIIQVNTILELAEAFAIRKKVFVEEQGIDEKLDFDIHDHLASHILVYYGEKPVATGRLLMEDDRGHISRIAVLKDFRGQGLGRIVVESLEKLARNEGAHAVSLHPHAYLKMFYMALGYHEVPNSKFKLGRHRLIKMIKLL